jgi:hypothetical protein
MQAWWIGNRSHGCLPTAACRLASSRLLMSPMQSSKMLTAACILCTLTISERNGTGQPGAPPNTPGYGPGFDADPVLSNLTNWTSTGGRDANITQTYRLAYYAAVAYQDYNVGKVRLCTPLAGLSFIHSSMYIADLVSSVLSHARTHACMHAHAGRCLHNSTPSAKATPPSPSS